MAYTDIATREITLPSGYHVTMRVARTVAQEEAARREDGRMPGYVLLLDLIAAWDLDDQQGVMEITAANIQRMTVPDAVFLINAYGEWQAERRTDVGFTATSPTGPGENETTRPPGSDSSPSIGSAGNNSA